MRCGTTGSCQSAATSFRDCKALLVTSLTHVSGAIASVQTFTFQTSGHPGVETFAFTFQTSGYPGVETFAFTFQTSGHPVYSNQQFCISLTRLFQHSLQYVDQTSGSVPGTAGVQPHHPS